MLETDSVVAKAIGEHEEWLRSWGERGKRAKIQDVSLWGSSVFRDRDLRYASFKNVAFTECDFSRANLVGAELQGNFSRSVFKHADLSHVNAYGANFENACLFNASLHKAVLSKASMRGTDLRGSTVCWALLSETDLRNAELDEYVVFEIMRLYWGVVNSEFSGDRGARRNMPLLDDYVYEFMRGFAFGG